MMSNREWAQAAPMEIERKVWAFPALLILRLFFFLSTVQECRASAPLLFSSDRIKTCFHTLETFYPLSGTQSYASCVCTGHCRAALLIWPGLMVLGWSPVCVSMVGLQREWRGGMAWLVYSLNFSRTSGLAQYMWPRQDVRRERKVWVIEAPPQNCRKGVHLHFSEEL